MTHTQRIESERAEPSKLMVFASVASVLIAIAAVVVMAQGHAR